MTGKPLVAVTGASSGIGAAVARAFSAEGHPVLMMARRLERMEAMGLPDTLCRKVDVRDRPAIAAAVAEAEATYGPVDMMFANAGVAHLANIGRQPPEEWDEMIDINTKGVMNTVHAVLDGMMARRAGTLFMMSSTAGRKVYPDHTVYCGTKFFIHAVSEGLRQYLSDYDVRVIVVAPGIVETEVLQGVHDETTLTNYNAKKKQIGGGLQPESVAEAMLNAYRMPQSVLIHEIPLTRTREKD
ncbi:MAG: SDR family oxidoreductase [Pseudomonadota bacterium]